MVIRHNMPPLTCESMRSDVFVMLSSCMIVPAVLCDVWPLSTDSSTTPSLALTSCCTCVQWHDGHQCRVI